MTSTIIIWVIISLLGLILFTFWSMALIYICDAFCDKTPMEYTSKDTDENSPPAGWDN